MNNIILLNPHFSCIFECIWIIVHILLLTQGNAKIVSLADRWATWIVVIALLAAVGTYVVTGEIIRAVTILVVFCPCALVLATPAAIM